MGVSIKALFTQSSTKYVFLSGIKKVDRGCAKKEKSLLLWQNGLFPWKQNSKGNRKLRSCNPSAILQIEVP